MNLNRSGYGKIFPGRKDFGGTDTGIDLVAKTELGDYWAIQCKCYAENTTIDKPAVDSFSPLPAARSQRGNIPNSPFFKSYLDFNHKPLGS